MAHYKWIINHLTDTDLYKYNMGQVIHHRLPNERSNWKLTIRSTNVKTAYLKDEVDYQIDHLCELRHGDDELNFLSDLKYLSDDYIEWLQDLRLKRKHIQVARDGDVLGIWTDGPEEKTQWFETLVMPIVQELWMSTQEDADPEGLGVKNLEAAVEKYNKLIDEGKNFTLTDFGTRRRYSHDWQDFVIRFLIKNCKAFIGTSNVYFAMKHGIRVFGTWAHQLPMLAQAISYLRPAEAQRFVFELWEKEFRGDQGIFLTDTFGLDAFLRDFDKLHALIASGLRHDSDDPFLWGQIIIEVYKQMGINPLTKTGCWSDSLKDDDVVDIVNTFWDKIMVAIGQGTFLTNNVGGNPLNMVMKLWRANGIDVVKLSDTAGKCHCTNLDQVNEIKRAFKYKPLSELKYLKDNPEAIRQYVAEHIAEHRKLRVWRG